MLVLTEPTPPNINGKAKTFSLRAVQPIKNTDKYELKTDLGMDITSVTSALEAGNTSISDYKLAVLRHGLNFK